MSRPMLRDPLAVAQPDRIRLHHAAVSVEALLSIVVGGIARAVEDQRSAASTTRQ